VSARDDELRALAERVKALEERVEEWERAAVILGLGPVAQKRQEERQKRSRRAHLRSVPGSDAS
jgi:hypothetical protein